MAVTGTGLSEGTKYENLRLISTMMEFSVGWVVTKNSGIKSPKDFKGKRLPHGFKAAPLFQFIQEGGLASSGMTFADVTKVPAVGLSQSWNMFMEGKVDGVIVNAGTGIVKQMNAKISGGVQHISYENSAESLKGMHKYFPRSEWKVLKPGKGLDSILEPTTLVNYDFVLWTHKGLSDDIAYKVAKIMHTKAAELKEGGPLWLTFKADARLCKEQGSAYHPGAVKYYKEVGLCPNIK
jgi:TRAP transporter TAXI family solute receptor